MASVYFSHPHRKPRIDRNRKRVLDSLPRPNMFDFSPQAARLRGYLVMLEAPIVETKLRAAGLAIAATPAPRRARSRGHRARRVSKRNVSRAGPSGDAPPAPRCSSLPEVGSAS